jgi:threonylcarbamoyladenosine tRNA methylthiotransferase MtaB
VGDVVKTFSIATLGCRVNHYESEQIATVLRARGLSQVDAPAGDVRVIHTCSVTMQAAKGSRQAIRRATRAMALPVLGQADDSAVATIDAGDGLGGAVDDVRNAGAKVIVTGCWATSDRDAAEKMDGVDAVITHHDDVHARLSGLLDDWTIAAPAREAIIGTRSLPLLGEHQTGHQRAFLKIQDGCDAHCTYCIIPQLRPALWSKPIDDAVAEASRLVASGHHELVLTGIFLGAYGQPTALRRRQERSTSKPIAELLDALCTRVPHLRRLRLSSLEPGDLDEHLIQTIRQHPQIVPHFHLPLQSGSDAILRKMNRQYTQSQFLDMATMVRENFDRPALTTDIITGFPGETDDAFAETLDVVDRVGFLHIHAFSYSPRPKTAAARWTKEFVPDSTANQRIRILNDLAANFSLRYRQSFVGETVEVLVERERDGDGSVRHGRCERYFDVHFDAAQVRTGDSVRVRIDSVLTARTFGQIAE